MDKGEIIMSANTLKCMYQEIYDLTFSKACIESLVLQSSLIEREHWGFVRAGIDARLEELYSTISGSKQLESEFWLFAEELISSNHDIDFELTKFNVIDSVAWKLDRNYEFNKKFLAVLIDFYNSKNTNVDYEQTLYIIANCLEMLPVTEDYYELIEAVLHINPEIGGERADYWHHKTLAFSWLARGFDKQRFEILKKLLESSDSKVVQRAQYFLQQKYSDQLMS